MRKFVATLFTALMLVAAPSVAFADPPDSDPTCGHQSQTEECPGDNGSEGCRGIEEARERADDEADPALDLVENILGEESDGECNGDG